MEVDMVLEAGQDLLAELSPELNKIPQGIRSVHLMGICGTAMASLAGMLKEKGFDVRGSDQDVYPPMSDLLDSMDIVVMKGYGPANLDPPPDLVIVGNVITRRNPEAVALGKMRIPYVSLPQAIKEFAIRGKKTIVVSGTHGKTTTSSAAAWMLQSAGMDPGFMIGGLPLNFGVNFRLGKGPYFVIEGDEYDTAFFDKGPKFLHYEPWICLLTSIEFDHADIYRDLDHVASSFSKLISLIPKEGLLVVNRDNPRASLEAASATCPVRDYGIIEEAEWRASYKGTEGGMTRFTVICGGRVYGDFHTPLFGRHNMSNLVSVVALGEFLGIAKDDIALALRTFKGVRRRQELVGEACGVTVLDDFAHHPTAVKETISAVKERYGGRRVVAVFEPRSNSSRRDVFQHLYPDSFYGAGLIMVPRPPLMEKIPPEERFSSERLAADLRKRGLDARYFDDAGAILAALLEEVRSNDVVLFMSNGAFDNLPRRFLNALLSKRDCPLPCTSTPSLKDG
jgi:UDP-N-acetylmuramate: L-alanyl-gamma-D-glutamyl-meso-diaminopimelate ligase